MKRMGENVQPDTYFENLVDICPLLIKEGLITSYPIKSVIESIADRNSLVINGVPGWRGRVQLIKLRDGYDKPNGTIGVEKINNEDYVIAVTLPKENSVFDNINSHMLKYGWFNSRSDENDDSIKYIFEKKFGDRFTVRQLKKMTNKIYHITSSRLKKKIAQQGLIPKQSKTPGFNNEPRIYFRPDLPSKDMVDNFNRVKFGNEPAVVVEVDLNKLKNDTAFFFDPRWQNSIFTFEPIPYSAVRIMDDSELPRIKLNY